MVIGYAITIEVFAGSKSSPEMNVTSHKFHGNTQKDAVYFRTTSPISLRYAEPARGRIKSNIMCVFQRRVWSVVCFD